MHVLMTIPYSFIPLLIFNIMIFISLLGYSLVIVLPWELQRLNELASLSWLWYMQFLPLEFLGKKCQYKTIYQLPPKKLFLEEHQEWQWVGICISLFPPAVSLAEIVQHCLFFISLSNIQEPTLGLWFPAINVNSIFSWSVSWGFKYQVILILLSSCGVLYSEIKHGREVSVFRKSIISLVLICTFRLSSKRKQHNVRNAFL